MKRAKLVWIIIVLLLLQNGISNEVDPNEDEIDLSLDENEEKPSVTQKKIEPPKIPPQRPPVLRFREDNDEFDDPLLLREQRIKGQKERNIHHSNNPNPQTSTQTQETQKKQKGSYHVFIEFLIEHYDYVFMGFFTLFIINTIYGKIKNKRIASRWFESNKIFFENNYAHLGFDEEYNQKSKSLMKPISYNAFSFFATGRVYVNWTYINLILKKRQDLISRLVSFFYFDEKDQISIISSLNPQNDIPVVFCISKKSKAKALHSKYPEIGDFTEMINLSFMGTNLVIMTENYDLIEKLFKDKSIQYLYKKVEPYIESIFYTDRSSIENCLTITCDITRVGQDKKILQDITILTHMLIDSLCSSTVKGQYKKDAFARRNKFDAKHSKSNSKETKRKGYIEPEKENKPTITREMAIKLEESKLKHK